MKISPILMMDWLLGQRLLKGHRLSLGVQFRLETVESKTAALRDLVQVSGEAGVLKGIFLLLDELEKQGGVLGPRAIIRYLSAVRAIVDALPRRLFLMIAITPDALDRYSYSLPALRSRLENRIELSPLTEVEEAVKLAQFYIDRAAKKRDNRSLEKAAENRLSADRKSKVSTGNWKIKRRSAATPAFGNANSCTVCTDWRKRQFKHHEQGRAGCVAHLPYFLSGAKSYSSTTAATAGEVRIRIRGLFVKPGREGGGRRSRFA